MSRTSPSKTVALSPLERHLNMGTQSVESLEYPQSSFVRAPKPIPTLGQHVADLDRTNLSMSSWRSIGHSLGTRSNIYVQPSSSLVDSHTVNMNGIQHENGLFSSSLSEIFNKKCEFSLF